MYDDNDLVYILLIDFSGRNMKSVLQFCNQALDDHSLFFQALYPCRSKPEGHCRDLHFCVHQLSFFPLSSYHNIRRMSLNSLFKGIRQRKIFLTF